MSQGLTELSKLSLQKLNEPQGLETQGLETRGLETRGIKSQGLEHRGSAEQQRAMEKLAELQRLLDKQTGRDRNRQSNQTGKHKQRGDRRQDYDLKKQDQRLTADASAYRRQKRNRVVRQVDYKQHTKKASTDLRQWAEELERLSNELIHLTKDKREQRQLAKRKVEQGDYQRYESRWMSGNQPVDYQNSTNRNKGLSAGNEETKMLQSQNRKLKKELQESADKLADLAKDLKRAERLLKPEVIIEKSIQKISRVSSKLKSQAKSSQGLDKTTNELDRLARKLSLLQAPLLTSSSHLEGGALPTATEQMPSLQMPSRQTESGVNLSKAEAQQGNGEGDMQKENNALPQSRDQLGSRIKQQMALKKLDDFILKLRRQQAARADAGKTSRKKRTKNASYQQQPPFPKGGNQQDAQQGGNELERSPRGETIASPYSMEEDLTQQAVFERIIRRLKTSRNIIAQFTPLSSPLPTDPATRLGPREGDFAQPENLPEVRGVTQWEEQQGVSRRKITPLPSPFPPNQLISFQEPQELSKYTQISTRAQITHEGPDKKRVKQAVPLPSAGRLTLAVDQQADESVRQQLIPQHYKRIICELYKPE
jgi:hypothetical protein